MNQYAERDSIDQGEYYLRHLLAMTEEKLHDKADIANELAYRDIEIDRLKAAMSTINDIRNSIVGHQNVSFSEHVYPLIFALDNAGFKGKSYAEAREDALTLHNQIAEFKTEIANGSGDYAKHLEDHQNELLSALRGLYDDITRLMSESEGVAGLHLNGNVAPWGELDKGGRFERLSHLTEARELIDKSEGE